MKYPRAAAPGGGVRKAGPDDRPSEKRNELDNLLTLCTTMHRRKIANARHHAQLHVLCNYPCRHTFSKGSHMKLEGKARGSLLAFVYFTPAALLVAPSALSAPFFLFSFFIWV